jgi:hypothetical protein
MRISSRASRGLEFIICLNLFFMELSQSYDLGCKFDMLTWIIFLGLSLIDFFSILLFNIELIGN